MQDSARRAVAIVGAGAILPGASNVVQFWDNIRQGRYSISEVSPDRWDPAMYYDADPKSPDKTYSKIGGWVREFTWDPVKWHLPIPPRVAAAMDDAQRWAIACTREALEDFGYPERSLDPDRAAVILGNAMAGEKHYLTAMRAYFPEYAHEMAEISTFAALPPDVRNAITNELHSRIEKRFPEITEDTMPGELANCIAGRIANLYNFHGPNFVVDAACASAMAAIHSSIEGLCENEFDVAITGGIDRNMGAPTFIKFCKIGALSGTGTRPYAEGADGFVMGEGAVIFLLKRLADAERDGDKIYAVFRGIGASSDGKGKGITAPNPIGQRLCIQRGWENAGLSPATASYIEGHGTSTRVGDVVEVESLIEVLKNDSPLPKNTVALGSVKSNLGHLKGAAGAAGILKTALALRDKVIPPSIHCERRNPDIDFAHSPVYVNTELNEWKSSDGARRAGVSAFGFGGTNFHAVMEEYIPGKLTGNGKRSIAVNVPVSKSSSEPIQAKAPVRGALALGGKSQSELMNRLRDVLTAAKQGRAPERLAPAASELHAPERIAVDYADAAELASKCDRALKALQNENAAMWKALRAQGIFRGHGERSKVAFLYPGQGSQYVNMLRQLREMEPIIGETFAEADRTMTPLLGKPLSNFVFVDPNSEDALAKSEEALRQTAITQPAVLASDIAITRTLAAYGIQPDMTMGHSLGEYGALVAAGALPFADALEAVSARGREMTRVSVEDNGLMAAVIAPLEEIERTLKTIDGYVVIANINSNGQAVIGGATKAVERAVEEFQKAGFNPVVLPVSHAFHTKIVAPASEPLRRILSRLRLQAPAIPVVANVNGEFYPAGPDAVSQTIDILAQQVAAPVQFVKGLRTLYDNGARVFVEVGPKKALQGFADDVLGQDPDVLALFTIHPKFTDVAAFNQALCGLYAAGLGLGREEVSRTAVPAQVPQEEVASVSSSSDPTQENTSQKESVPMNNDKFTELGHIFAEALERGWKVYGNNRDGNNQSRPSESPVVITGAALGLPGTEHIFDDSNIGRILRGDQFIDVIPTRFRRAMLEKEITRLVKSDNGGPSFETITDINEVIKLAGRGGAFNPSEEFGVPAERVEALDRVTSLAIAAGIDALRDAGIPLVMRYKATTKGTKLPERWALPESLADDTGVIFASAFPGYDSLADALTKYHEHRARVKELETLESLLERAGEQNGSNVVSLEIQRRITDLKSEIEKNPYVFDRRFLLRVLSMGHSQFAEYIGARGPNTQINAACSSTTMAIGLAEDWIKAGHCRRVIVVSADDITTDHLIDWMGAGFLATGAAATDELVEEAAVPFDRRRHGMIIGMGAAAVVVESTEAARERGIQPICEVLSTVAANSAFHATRLDVEHISQVMESLVSQAESRHGIRRDEIAGKTVFVSHETYTPARGGSASAEINSLRRVFGSAADKIVIANTKGFTGHAMATGIEDVVAVKALETGCVPPVPNFREVDPELGNLNLSKGGTYDVEYALRLAAGFGSQISMALLRWVKTKDGKHAHAESLGYATRIADQDNWNAWLTKVAGQPQPELEVVKHTLRVHDQFASSKKSEVPKVERTAERVDEKVRADAAETKPKAEPETKPKIEPVAKQPEPKGAPAPPPRPEPIAAPVPTVKVTSDDGQPVEADEVPVKDRVLAIVAEKTGYPIEMLDLDLDMEADLGVDTVKQAEVFAAIREIYAIPRDPTLKLRDFPTLTHVIQFVNERRTDKVQKTPEPTAAAAPSTQAPMVEPPTPATPPPTSSTSSEAPAQAAATTTTDTEIALPPPAGQLASGDVREQILDLLVEKTGYPKEMLDLDLDLEADLGIDTVKQAELFASIRQLYGIERDPNLKLRDFPTLKHVIGFVYSKRPDLAEGTRQQAAPASATPPINVAPLEQLITETETETETAPATEGAPAVQAEHHEDEVAETVLTIAAEATGYSKEVLGLDLDLEGDLGIDSIKQAEMFAAVQSAYDMPHFANLTIRDFPTLSHVINFARGRRTGAPHHHAHIHTASAAAEEQAVTAKTAQISIAPVRNVLSFEAANRVPRRIPVPSLRPPLDMCKRTDVQLKSGGRVVLMPDLGGVGDALIERLGTKGVQVLKLDRSLDANGLAAVLTKWVQEGPVQGVYWLAGLDDHPALTSMDLRTWREAIRVRVKSLYTCMRTLYDSIASKETFLIVATSMGGYHGYDEQGATAPLGGAAVGFAKAFKREQIDALVKAVDFELGREFGEVAELLVAETLRDPGAVEIGYKSGLRWTIQLQEEPIANGGPGIVLNYKTVFVVTGAAGSIVSAITSDLASASGGTFYLLDLVPQPDPNNSDLQRFVTDKEGLKREIFARIQARGERATPALVEKELAAMERARAVLDAIEAVERAGGKACYYSVDLKDSRAVAAVIDQIRAQSGRIDVLLHAAGIERSRLLPDKDAREYDLVFDVKADGFFNLLQAIGDMPLGATVAFSSIAGRFGNAGQTDYSAANDLLCKITSSLRRTHPSTRAIAIDWTAWKGIGMASRGSIPKIMEAAGIDMLSPEVGVPIIRRELTTSGFRGEVLIGERLGLMMNEWDSEGGLDPVECTRVENKGPMAGRLIDIPVNSEFKIETRLDPKEQPFLYDHQIEGTPVLPGVMGIEAFAEAALSVLPGWHIETMEDINFHAPFKFYRNEPRTFTVTTKFRPIVGGVLAECALVGTRMLPNKTEPQITTHFSGRVLLTKQAGAMNGTVRMNGGPVEPILKGSDIYRVFFHGPAYQVLECAWRDEHRMLGEIKTKLPDNHHPANRPLYIAPRAIESCLQTAGLWEITVQASMGLPQHIEKISFVRDPKTAQGVLFAVVTPDERHGTYDADVVDSSGTRYLSIYGYRTVPFMTKVDAEPLKWLQTVAA